MKVLRTLQPCLLLLVFGLTLGARKTPQDALRQEVLDEARALLEQARISYVYGGHQVGTGGECAACNVCLGERQPGPRERWKACPNCVQCSLDCSHFTQLVLSSAGLQHPYLTTDSMNGLPKEVLARRYQFVDLGRDLNRALPGDLLVYKGHVVLLEALQGKGQGDVIHATGGRDIKGPGQGIQRERLVPLASFRGPLLRILRHSKLYATPKAATKLRPVVRRTPSLPPAN